MQPILAGRTVLELGTMLAAPFAGHMLAQLGADVIKIEPPAGDPTRSMVRGGPSGTFIAYSRGKKSLCVDLKLPEGRSVFERMVAKSDIVLHNLAPASARRLGVTDADCRRARSDIVYCHIQGYGAGPLADDLASNPLVEASTGAMYAHRVNGRPTRLGPSYLDQFAGSYAVIGILSAVAAPPGDSRARCVEVGLYETGMHVAARDLVTGQLKTYLGQKQESEGGGGEFNMPGYGTYQTSDGRWLYLMMLTDGHWGRFCDALSLPQAGDESLATVRQRKKRRAEVEDVVNSAIQGLSYEVATARLKEAGVGYTEVMPAAKVLDAPQARQAGKLTTVPFQGYDFEAPNFPLPNQCGRPAHELPPPLLGQHTIEILRALDYDAAACNALLEQGVVCAPKPGGPLWTPLRER